VTMSWAWERRAASLQRPGTTTTGPTPPSSLVTGLASTGWRARLGWAPSSPGPKTRAPWLAALPVMDLVHPGVVGQV
jgi:hypothetical protein